VLLTKEVLAASRVPSRLHVARDGQEALDFLYRRSGHAAAPDPDLILLDLNLPKYAGLDVLAKIKTDHDLARIPVVILTTSSSEQDVLRSYQLHANAFVTKPADVTEFMAAVRQIDQFFLTTASLPGVRSPSRG
jgi:CheY-like chemotaxis protein